MGNKIYSITRRLFACFLRFAEGGMRGCAPALLACILLFSPLPASAQPLMFLLQRLAVTHPALVSVSEQANAAATSIDEAKAGYFPKVSVGAGYGYTERDRQNSIGSNGKKDSDPLDASLSISQNLFEGFRTDGSIGSAQAAANAAQARVRGVRQQIFLQAIDSYISLVKQLHLLQLSQQNMITLQNQVALEQERMTAGTGISVDVLLAQSRLQLAQDRYASFLGAFQQAEASFVQFFGIEPDYRALQIPGISQAMLPRSLPQAIEIALQNSPAVEQTSFQVQSADNDRTVARAGYFPRLDVQASSAYQDASDDISGETSTNSIVLRGSWDLFSGFVDQSREKRAIHNFQSSLANAQNTQRQVIEDTKQAWAALTASQQRSVILGNAVNIAQQVYAARLRLRDIGSETAINVLDAENELFNAQINAASTQYDSYSAAFKLAQAIGMLELNAIR